MFFVRLLVLHNTVTPNKIITTPLTGETNIDHLVTLFWMENLVFFPFLWILLRHAPKLSFMALHDGCSPWQRAQGINLAKSYIKSPVHGGADVDRTWLGPIEAWTLDLWVLPVVSRALRHWEGTLWILSSLSCSQGHSWSAFTLWQRTFSSRAGT